MIEERRFFLRTALFATAIAIVYWFLSYEAAGSVMLLAIGLCAAFLTAVLRSHSNETKRGPLAAATHLVNDMVTFEDPEEGSSAPLAIEEQEAPPMSYPPLAVAVGAGAIAGGLVFGAWLWLPGAVLVTAAGWHWFEELDATQTDSSDPSRLVS